MYKILLSILLLVYPVIAWSQTSTWHFSIEGQAISTPKTELPFWLRADQYGSIPLTGVSGSFIGNIHKNYDTTKHHFFDWAASIQTRVNLGNTTYLTLIEAYIKAKMGVFEIKAGRSKDIEGLIDSTLSTGSFSISGNSLGIPKVGLSMPNYYNLGFLGNLFAFKAAYNVGYFGNVSLVKSNDFYVSSTRAYYQENELYIQFGKPGWKLKLQGGINHEVMFGDENKILGSWYTLSPFETFVYAATGRTFNNYSKVGNHIGSVDAALKYDFDKTYLFIYRQNVYDEGALFHLANLADGINGVSLTNKDYNAENGWKKFLFEFIYTANQAGYFNSPYVKSGDENYYNNYEYRQGWTYDNLNLGNPLLATRQYTRKNLVTDPDDYFIDNRVEAFDVAFKGTINKINILTKLTYSENYGTFGTSPEGHSLGSTHQKPVYGLFGQINEFSGYLEIDKTLPKKWDIGVAIADDNGQLYYNSLGILLKIKKVIK